MKNEKSTDAILADFIKGERRARIFNFVIIIIVPIGVLIVTFAAVNNISSRYFIAKREILFELSAKEAELRDKEKELEKLKGILRSSASVAESESVGSKSTENREKNEKISDEFKHLQKTPKKLK